MFAKCFALYDRILSSTVQLSNTLLALLLPITQYDTMSLSLTSLTHQVIDIFMSFCRKSPMITIKLKPVTVKFCTVF